VSGSKEIQDGGFENSVAQISACTHDSKEITTATLMFLGTGNTDKLLRILSYDWACWKSKMAAINRKQIGNNIYLSSYT